LTPYDVLIIASMVEKETLSPDERQLVAAVIYNRSTNACRSDRRDCALRPAYPSDRVDLAIAATNNPYNTRKLPAHADADRQPRSGVMQAARTRPGELLYFVVSRQEAPLLHGELRRFERYKAEHGYP
jgi:cell division protein YceG involved in septum cleavage